MSEDQQAVRRQSMKLLADNDDPPAFLQRAQRVELVWEALLHKCRRDRFDLLEIARTRLGCLAVYVDHDWQRLSPFVSEDDIRTLRGLVSDWQPELQGIHAPTSSSRRVRRALVDLESSFARFNQRWDRYLDEVSLAHVNNERGDYNRYYVIEKSCALGSDRLAEMGFKPLRDLTRDDVLAALPMLPAFRWQ